MPFSRGEHCNGADAGDMPMAPLLLHPRKSVGKITHAMRFTTLEQPHPKGVYVHPATHVGGPWRRRYAPVGARLRLRADYPMASLPSDAARTIATALQTYGMFLADGGNMAFRRRPMRLRQPTHRRSPRCSRAISRWSRAGREFQRAGTAPGRSSRTEPHPDGRERRVCVAFIPW